jgi:ABC-type uncharacterized transport system substrate-binding protein
MNRREFITLLGSTMAIWPLASRAQQMGKLPNVGIMDSGTAAAQSQWTMAFVQRIRELGWTEGRNMAIEYRWAEARNERFPEIVAEFVRLKVDVILTHNTLPTLAAKQAASAIPVVFATHSSPSRCSGHVRCWRKQTFRRIAVSQQDSPHSMTSSARASRLLTHCRQRTRRPTFLQFRTIQV